MSISNLGTGGLVYLRKSDNTGPLDDLGFLGQNKVFPNDGPGKETVLDICQRALPSGGTAADYRFRVFIDTAAPLTHPYQTFNPVTAVEITEELLIRGRNNPPVKTSVTVTANAIEFKRMVDLQIIAISGAPANPDLTSAVVDNAYVGDRYTFRLAATADPFILKNNAVFVIDRDMQFASLNDSIELEVTNDSPLTFQEVSRKEAYEAPPGEEVFDWTVPTSGTLNVQPRTFNAAVREHNVRLSGTVTLVANLAVQLDTTNLEPGDSGVIEGYGSAITLAGNDLTITDSVVSVQVRPQQALSGKWRVEWKWDGTNLALNLVTSRGVGESPWEDLQVITALVSWDTAEQSQNGIEMPFDGEVVKVNAWITKPVAATDNATIDLQFGASFGIITFAPSTIINQAQTFAPVPPEPFLATDTLLLETAKVTPGGKALVTVHVRKT